MERGLMIAVIKNMKNRSTLLELVLVFSKISI